MDSVEKVFERWSLIVGEEELEGYRKAGMGQRLGFGKKPALLIIDVTIAFVDPKYPVAHGDLVKQAVSGIKEVLEASRNAKLPIIFIKPKQRTPIEAGIAKNKMGFLNDFTNPDVVAWPEEIKPIEGEHEIEKTRPSAFFETHLRSMLTYLGVDTVIVTGNSTSGCVRASVVDASYCNFRPIIPEQCCGDRSTRAHYNNLFDMDMKYADVTDVNDVLAHIKSITQ